MAEINAADGRGDEGEDDANERRAAQRLARRNAARAARVLRAAAESDSESEEEKEAIAAAPVAIGRRAKRLAKLKGAGVGHQTIVPADGIPWRLATHIETHTRTLTEDDPRAPDPPGFKGKLFPPQATMLHAMLELEKTPFLRLSQEKKGDTKHPIIQTNRALVSEALGFGKTVCVEALICSSRRPRDLPQAVNIPLISGGKVETGPKSPAVKGHLRNTNSTKPGMGSRQNLPVATIASCQSQLSRRPGRLFRSGLRTLSDLPTSNTSSWRKRGPSPNSRRCTGPAASQTTT